MIILRARVNLRPWSDFHFSWKILLFDEATSALDSQTEKEIQKALRIVSRDRTALVIAHRLSTIVDADIIIVLELGQIVERGRHEELLVLDGTYATMWRRQQEQAEALQRLERLDKDAGLPLDDNWETVA